ncbi:hypothetical protein E4U53_001058 [Claviceps sorghi]|nr:hypothetical protein E4U53_001058 [Claviceps sorghi]
MPDVVTRPKFAYSAQKSMRPESMLSDGAGSATLSMLDLEEGEIRLVQGLAPADAVPAEEPARRPVDAWSLRPKEMQSKAFPRGWPKGAERRTHEQQAHESKAHESKAHESKAHESKAHEVAEMPKMAAGTGIRHWRRWQT